MLSFGDFTFDPEQQVLLKSGEPVHLSSKQVTLLGLLITNPARIHSKDQILEEVWGGRAVSEQVVFQNISALRGVLGQAAIKTFPKRGYQWDVALGAPESAKLDPRFTRHSGRELKRVTTAVAFVVSAIIILFVANWFLTDSDQGTSQQPVHVIALEARPGYDNQAALSALNSVIRETGVDVDGVTSRSFMKSPYMVRKAIGASDGTLVVGGMLHQGNGYLFLDYIVQGERRSWRAIVEGHDAESVGEGLREHLIMLQTSRYFDQQEESAVSAELALMHERAPAEGSVLAYLAEQALELERLDVAGAYADKLQALAVQTMSPVNKTMAHWLKGRVALALEDPAAAREQLSKAQALASAYGLIFVEPEILKSAAEVAYADQDFDAITLLLSQSAALARQAGDPVKEVRAYTLLSIMANKLGLQQKASEYLKYAERLLADEKFDESHYMLVDYHFALFSDESLESMRWLRAALTRPVTPENAWVLDSAADRLVSQLLGKGRVIEAVDVADVVQEEATAHRLRAKIHLAEGNRSQALHQAKTAFNIARINGKKWVAMPMALLLLELDGEGPDASEYRRYLLANRRGRWAEWEEARVRALGLEP